jgi:ABC-2 type transport system permease protein
MIARILAIVVKEFIHLRRDWWLPAFMLIGGTMELLLVGWATSRPITNLPLMVLDRDRGQASRSVVTALENTGTFQLVKPAEDMAAIEEAMIRGDINAAVLFPADFSEQLASTRDRPVLPVYLNGAESIPATTALRAIEGVTTEMGQQIAVERLGLRLEDVEGFDPGLRVWFNEQLSDALYTVPAELGLMLEFIILLFAALSFSRERELGTLEQLLVMPFSSLEIIIGKAIPAVIVGFSSFNIMLLMIHFAFDVPVRGSIWLLEGLAFTYLLVELSKGLILSIVSRTQLQAFLLVFLIGMVDFMFTGYAAPVESMPQVLQKVALLIPAHHWLNIFRGILLKGAGLDILWPGVLALLALGLIIGTISIRYMRRALD